jgi:hypothetical protein
MSASSKPQPPSGTKASGRRLWRSLVDDVNLEEHYLALLREAVRTVDMLDSLAEIIADEGPMIDSPQGRRMHPAVIEARQLKIVLARLLAALRLPSNEDDRRPQRRGGARGVYMPPPQLADRPSSLERARLAGMKAAS